VTQGDRGKSAKAETGTRSRGKEIAARQLWQEVSFFCSCRVVMSKSVEPVAGFSSVCFFTSSLRKCGKTCLLPSFFGVGARGESPREITPSERMYSESSQRSSESKLTTGGNSVWWAMGGGTRGARGGVSGGKVGRGGVGGGGGWGGAGVGGRSGVGGGKRNLKQMWSEKFPQRAKKHAPPPTTALFWNSGRDDLSKIVSVLAFSKLNLRLRITYGCSLLFA